VDANDEEESLDVLNQQGRTLRTILRVSCMVDHVFVGFDHRPLTAALVESSHFLCGSRVHFVPAVTEEVDLVPLLVIFADEDVLPPLHRFFQL
jgi:hypothetical protein